MDDAVQFRKKPVVIEAVRWDGANFAAVADFCRPGMVICHPAYGTVSIQTREGIMIASQGDWIIRGTQGEFYPCKPDIFEEVYEPVLG